MFNSMANRYLIVSARSYLIVSARSYQIRNMSVSILIVCVGPSVTENALPTLLSSS